VTRQFIFALVLLDHQKNSKNQNKKVNGDGDEVAERQNRYTRLAPRR